jgi:hypothetical protein
MIIPQKVNVILNKKNNTYYTSLIDNKHYLLSFRNKEIASNCASFLAEYKHRYNMFPPINSENFKPTEILDIDERIPVDEIITKDLRIVPEYTNYLLTLCNSLSLELLILNDFKYRITQDTTDIDFSAYNLKIEDLDISDTFINSYLDSLLD